MIVARLRLALANLLIWVAAAAMVALVVGAVWLLGPLPGAVVGAAGVFGLGRLFGPWIDRLNGASRTGQRLGRRRPGGCEHCARRCPARRNPDQQCTCPCPMRPRSTRPVIGATR